MILKHTQYENNMFNITTMGRKIHPNKSTFINLQKLVISIPKHQSVLVEDRVSLVATLALPSLSM